MAFDKEEIKQLETLLDNLEQRFDDKLDRQKSEISLDTRSIVRQELEPVIERLDQLFQMESEDIQAAYIDISNLKKRVRRLELKRV